MAGAELTKDSMETCCNGSRPTFENCQVNNSMLIMLLNKNAHKVQ